MHAVCVWRPLGVDQTLLSAYTSAADSRRTLTHFAPIKYSYVRVLCNNMCCARVPIRYNIIILCARASGQRASDDDNRAYISTRLCAASTVSETYATEEKHAPSEHMIFKF